MDRHEVDSVVIGAGAVGLAVARRLALAGREVLILERNPRFGEETSSRNSEVIHAGLYYPEGSLKGALCVEGKHALYAFCEARGVPHRRLGKLVVAADAEEAPALARVAAAAAANGVDDLVLLSRARTLALEPALDVAEAFLSPSTGVLDSHAYMLALLGEAEARGAQLVCGARIEAGALRADGRMDLAVAADAPVALTARHVVVAAGLRAAAVARRLEGLDPASIPRQRLAKGSYYRLSARAPFSRLVYPTPVSGGLGVHLTLDLGGGARFGPDVEWLDEDDPDRIDYSVDPRRGDAFYAAIRRYWPELPDGALAPDYSGVRPKLSGPGEPAADFRIDGGAAHGAWGHVMLYGIESPGLTASLAIAERVAAEALDSAVPAKRRA